MQQNKYSIIVPVFNSSSTLHLLVNRMISILDGYDFELIFVDDGSTDNSWNILTEFKTIYAKENIKIIRLVKNFSQHNATICGLKKAIGNYIITIDDDLQTPPEEIIKLINKINETNADVVYGVFKNQQQTLFRKLFRSVVFRIIKKFNENVENTSSFRIIKKETVDNMTKHPSFFINIDEVLIWYTKHILTVEVEHQSRVNGKSGYSLFGLIKMSLKILFSFYSFPLKFIISTGFFISFISIVLAVVFLIKKIFFNVGVEGWTSLMVSIMFSTGVILLTLGIIGKYLLNILTFHNGKPAYVIAEELE